MSNYISSHQWIYTELGSGNLGINGAEALAWQDTFIRHVPLLNQNEHHKPTGFVHIYQLDYPTILIGPKDAQLTQLDKAVDYLKQNHFAVHQRAHGGLAVVSDAGILNISFITDLSQYPLSIDEAYEQLVHWVRTAFAPLGLTIESYEIVDSYCPGKYDLVINGLKIGGIAQRRFKTGVATAAYLSINGQQQQRAQHIQTFYTLGQATNTYPNVQPDSMATIQSFLEQPITLLEAKELLLDTIHQQATLTHLNTLTPELLSLYKKMYAKALERNQTL